MDSIPTREKKSPVQRMMSIRFNKKKTGSIRRESPISKVVSTVNDSNEVVWNTESVKWARNKDVVDKVLNEVKDELSAQQLKSVHQSPSTLDVIATIPLEKKAQLSAKPKPTRTKSSNRSNFFKLRSNKTDTKEQAHLQQIDLREIEICQQIGRGASSAGVFLCLVDGWACAMKQLKREHVGAVDIKCFEREMDILYQLPPHPSIVRYLFHTSIGTDLCLFMQLYSGTLREYLDVRRKTNDHLPPDKIAQIALETAKGIQFLHQHGVIHRDIKAGNIFITKNEKDEITRIAIGDFDTSLRVSASLRNLKDPSADMVSHDFDSFVPTPKENTLNTAQKRNYFAQNRPRSIVGTTGFMAPEVLRSRGSTPYGFKADIYSFGMLLYEMLTLKLPFEQLDTCDTIDAVIAGQQVASMEIEKEIREKYQSLVDLYTMCTNNLPDLRPSSDKIIKQLAPMMQDGAFTLKVSRKPSLVEQLNKYNSTSRLNPELSNLDMVMEEDILNNGQGRNNTPSVTFRGPQTQGNLDRKYPAALGIHSERDHIVRVDDDISKQESVEIYSPRAKLGKSKDKKAKMKKEKSSLFKDKKKRVRSSSHSKNEGSTSEIDYSPSDPTFNATTKSLKKPKRNVVSKSTLQKYDTDA